jgi:hypothetical protein
VRAAFFGFEGFNADHFGMVPAAAFLPWGTRHKANLDTPKNASECDRRLFQHV